MEDSTTPYRTPTQQVPNVPAMYNSANTSQQHSSSMHMLTANTIAHPINVAKPMAKSLLHGGACRSAGRDAGQAIYVAERWQNIALERSGEGGAAGVGDLGVVEVELLELRQHSSRRWQRTRGQRRWRQEGGKALVAERVVRETESLQRRPPPQGRREGHKPRIGDGGVPQMESLEPRQGASAQGGGEGRGACVSHMHPEEP
eukprot:scaffold46760_cov39-Phaeocystis_antarctica.AAC.5